MLGRVSKNFLNKWTIVSPNSIYDFGMELLSIKRFGYIGFWILFAFVFLAPVHTFASDVSFYRLSIEYANAVIEGRVDRKCDNGFTKFLQLSATTHIVSEKLEGKTFSQEFVKKARLEGVKVGRNQIICVQLNRTPVLERKWKEDDILEQNLIRDRLDVPVTKTK